MPTYTPKTILEGSDLMLFYEDNGTKRSIAYATSHQLALTSDVANINSKDHGQWRGNEINKQGWEITAEHLLTEDEFSTIFACWKNKTKVEIVFALKSQDASIVVADGDAQYYTPDTTTVGKKYLAGSAYITSLNVGASDGEKATMSITFTGTGAIAETTVASV